VDYLREKIHRTTRPEKICRYCRETIPGLADVCPLCGHRVVGVPGTLVIALMAALGLALVLFVGLELLQKPPRPASSDVLFEEGRALGWEAGQRQAQADEKENRPADSELPGRYRFFLKDKSRPFQQGFRQGYIEGYGRAGP
jgi:hypothetical protein